MRNLKTLALFALGALALSSCGKPDSSLIDQGAGTDYAGETKCVSGSGDRPGGNNFCNISATNNFADLINNYAQSKPNHAPWASYWWAYTQNGIASGAYGSGKSPAGKYDAARGHQTNAQAWEVANHGSKVKDVQGWWGHCNGWCASAALYDEPRHSETVNGITFEVPDLKALLAEAGMWADADFYGNRTSTGDFSSPKYYDTVADQYFLVLTNYMGRSKQPVLIDRYTGDQIWNQPLVGYKFEKPKKSDYLGVDPRAPGVYRILVRSTIWWANDSGVSANVLTPVFNWEDVDNEYGPVFQHRDLESEIWLDAPPVFNDAGDLVSSGNVIVTQSPTLNADGSANYVGGRWPTEYFADANNSWPDYMWVPFQVQRPLEPARQAEVNPDIDINWIEEHLVNRSFPNGKDDASAPRNSPIENAPSPGPASPTPGAGDHAGCGPFNPLACIGLGGSGGGTDHARAPRVMSPNPGPN